MGNLKFQMTFLKRSSHLEEAVEPNGLTYISTTINFIEYVSETFLLGLYSKITSSQGFILFPEDDSSLFFL